MRRLGDLLLATPLIRSMKQAWPEATIDVLAAKGTESMLVGNPDVGNVIAYSRRTPLLSLTRQLLRRYDLSVSLQPEDRAQFLALLAAPLRASIVPSRTAPGARWKRRVNRFWHPVDLHTTHAVVQYLRLADAMGIPRNAELVPPRPADTRALEAALGNGWEQHPVAVVHPAPMFRYKAWTRDGWITVIRWLAARGLRVAITGGPGVEERGFVDSMLGELGLPSSAAINLAGQLQFCDLTPLLEHASVYIGPDTSVTHLAAAAGTPTVALFGPSNPSAWAPWPRGYSGSAGSPWVHVGALQQHSNVWLVQGIQHCVPCMQEGCERRRDSRADCLDGLPAARVIAAINDALETRSV